MSSKLPIGIVAGCAGLVSGLYLSLKILSEADIEPKAVIEQREDLRRKAITERLLARATGQHEDVDLKRETKDGINDIGKIKEMFKKLDLDGDSKIDRGELKSFLNKIGKVAISATAPTLFRRITTTGFVTPTGYLSPNVYKTLKMEAKLTDLMDKYDIDKDGTLDEVEFWKFCTEYLSVYHPMMLA